LKLTTLYFGFFRRDFPMAALSVFCVDKNKKNCEIIADLLKNCE